MPVPARLPEPHHRTVQAGDISLHVVQLPGEGRPLLLLHGIGMDWRVWQALLRRLYPGFSVTLVDLRGHGQSDKPAHGYTLGHYAADIEDLLETLDLGGVIVVGSSLGGMVAASIEAPVEMVTHRILVDPPLTGGSIRDEEMFREILRLKREPPRRLADFLAAYNPGSGAHYLKAMSEMWHEAADGVITDMLARPDEYYAIEGALAGNESPTLILQADPALGGVLTDAQAARAAALMPRGNWMRVPGAGHAIHAYKPAEFVRLIDDFTSGSGRLIDGGWEVAPGGSPDYNVLT